MRPISRKPSEIGQTRMQPLAKLPVFFDLADRRVVVAGGSAAAAWKAELLLACGAKVEIYAPEISTELEALLTREESSGTISVHQQRWTSERLAGAAIAVAAVDSSEEAQAFSEAARKAGVPVNVIDNPDVCQFQFGTIVNRSPIVIGISTDGAAPILGQAIRRRIEMLLPEWLSRWARIAKSIRREVISHLPFGVRRREFWEKFSDLAFKGPPQPNEYQSVAALLDNIRTTASRDQGRVTLVGAGPGDPELLTVKAVRAMQAADVILFDDLVSTEVLDLARREAQRMLVGKRGGRESCKQEDINELMVKLAHQGKHVVRLKSGDPMIFGRAGEEIALLEAAGIPVTVVAGLTAASAMAAELGVSLTHRDMAHSVRYVTGHSRHGRLPDNLDWSGLADPETSLVFYMGGRTAPSIAERLISEGLQPTTPAIVQFAISRPEATRLITTLAGLRNCRELLKSGQPVLIGIGKVFAGVSTASQFEGVTSTEQQQFEPVGLPSAIAGD